MFATLLGDLPRPPLPVDAAPHDLVYFALEAQATAGLEPLTDGGLWGKRPTPDPVARWRATAALTNRAVKAVVPGPYSSVEAGPDYDERLSAAADATNTTLRGLAAAGCALAEVHEPMAASIGSDPASRRHFAMTTRRALDGVTGIHRSLAIVGAAADAAGIDTILAAPWDSLALDLVGGPDNWRLATAAPGEIGIVAGALGAGERADQSVEVLLFAIGYAASTRGRGHDRVGIATAGTLAHLSWEVAVRRMRILGDAVRLTEATTDERAATLDPRAISSRAAALGRRGIRRTRRGA